MHRARTRALRPPTERALPPGASALAEFYREEFLKHHRCLHAQREYYSEQAIAGMERALLRIVAEMDTLTAAGGDDVVERLLRELDVVTGLSAWSDSRTSH
jgi:hypothetical protein